tara:strand:+ start:4091 stop:5413 length:1323 start_codon:yes stop_codon:yes gene_type:complete
MNSLKTTYSFLSIIKDFLIIYFVYNNEFNKIFNVSPNLIIIFFLVTFWLLVNYILGQYEWRFKELGGKILSNGLNTFFILISASIIYIYINLLTDEININIADLFIYLNTIFKIFLYILITQSIIDLSLKNYFINVNKWFIISNDENFEELIKINSRFNNNFKFIRSEKEIFQGNYKDLKGLIIDQQTSYKYIESKIYIEAKKRNLEILNILQWYEKYLYLSPNTLNSLNDLLSLELSLNFNNINYRIKRLGDICFSLFLLIALFPLIVIIIISLIIIQGNPIIYLQTRTGLNFKTFKIRKFRTMIINAEIDGPQWSNKNDTRVTFIGKILRKFRLDELPQLLNVIKGDMSLIGPRPERPEFDKELNRKIYNYNFRYSIKPGLSGWAQVNYHYGANINDTINKLNYDIYYIKNQSILLDLIILIKTIKIVFNARGWVSNS